MECLRETAGLRHIHVLLGIRRDAHGPGEMRSREQSALVDVDVDRRATIVLHSHRTNGDDGHRRRVDLVSQRSSRQRPYLTRNNSAFSGVVIQLQWGRRHLELATSKVRARFENMEIICDAKVAGKRASFLLVRYCCDVTDAGSCGRKRRRRYFGRKRSRTRPEHLIRKTFIQTACESSVTKPSWRE